ncbi:MAG: cytochrome C [Cereibacter sphaeroides]|uniref:Cytochrome C n=1 Tax=Cereibacter sphaeroides TaxID=1063 RepID=A0A2W5SB02_CERSP|nr:MAG: cytochrome C [Cereibacter sphaeroides]
MSHHARQTTFKSILPTAGPATVLILFAFPALAFFHAAPDIEGGRVIYAARCASCHGANLEGQPNWQSGNEDGTYPAPPHDQTGHTWHHGDAMLQDYIRRGGQVVLNEMGVDFTSGMPGFGDVLNDTEIAAVLDFIRSTWPDRVRAVQAERSSMEAITP